MNKKFKICAGLLNAVPTQTEGGGQRFFRVYGPMQMV
jgi:hypothetical protein